MRLCRVWRVGVQAEPHREAPRAQLGHGEPGAQPEEEERHADGRLWGEVELGGHREGNGHV